MMQHSTSGGTSGRRPVAGTRAGRLVWAAPLLWLLACGDGGTGPAPKPTVSAIQVISGNAQTAPAGEVLQDSLVVLVTDAKGQPIPGVSVSWSVESGGGSVAPSSLTGAGGRAAVRWTLGTVAGSASLRVTAGDRNTTFTATIIAASLATLTVAPPTFTLDPGGQRQLQALAADVYGNAVTVTGAVWESSEPLIASVDNAGVVRAVGGGTASIRVSASARSAAATVTVTGTPAAVPTISAITPALLTPGAAGTITGTNFATAPGATTVTISGIAAATNVISDTQLAFTMPAADRLPCTPTAPVEVAVRVGTARAARPHPLQTASPRSLAVGEVVFGTAGAPLGCIELAAGTGRYLVAVYNAGPAFAGAGQTEVSNGPGIQVRTATTPSGNVVAAAPLAPTAPARVAAARPRFASSVRLRRHLQLHEQLLESNIRLMRQVRLPARQRLPAQAALLTQPAALGDSIWIRFPDVSKASSIACSQFDSVRARVAHVGTRSIVLEDINAPLAGQLDTLFQRMGQQFDQVQYPVIRDNFGDPLTLDAQLNNDGKLYMLFTSRVNNLLNGGVLGFVWSGDFDDGTGCPQSNRAEIFYGIVPTTLGEGGSSDWNLSDWYDYTRSTVVHEVKHVASMATRQQNINTPFPADSMWLEEAGAMVAEEIWARHLFGYQQRGNTGFDQSILCELNLSGSGCTGMPLVMLNHFAFLYDYYDQPESHSLLGKTSSADATFYGSAWAFLRWLTDHSGMTEAQFLTALNQASTAGLTSVQAVTGRSYEELLREYLLTMALDDRPGLTAASPRLAQPSWDTRDVFAGMSRLRTVGGGIPFPLEFPLVPTVLAAPGATVSEIRPAGGAFFELQLSTTAAQAFDVVSADGGALPGGLRVAIVRVQ